MVCSRAGSASASASVRPERGDEADTTASTRRHERGWRRRLRRADSIAGETARPLAAASPSGVAVTPRIARSRGTASPRHETSSASPGCRRSAPQMSSAAAPSSRSQPHADSSPGAYSSEPRVRPTTSVARWRPFSASAASRAHGCCPMSAQSGPISTSMQ
eukprot:scaffold236966_cov27-Tisochrysis_lutea.AAC.4